MSEITDILGYSNFELIRSQIAFILADELAKQKELNVAALALEIVKPEPDPILIELYELNIACIPSKVWMERFRRPSEEDFPMLNVVFINAPLDELQSHSTQIGIDRYQIEVFQMARDSKEGAERVTGDVHASKKAQRLLALCRLILMDRNYESLGFPGLVGYRQVREISMAQPDTGTDNSFNAVGGKLDVLVKIGEYVTDLTGNPLYINLTNMKLEDEKGYHFEIDNTPPL